MFKELEIVALTKNAPALGLREGDVGTIVNVHPDGQAFMVEFVTSNGRTAAIELFDIDQIRALRPDESMLGRAVAV
jgi:hypothetical protein